MKTRRTWGRCWTALLLCASGGALALLGLTVNRLPDRTAQQLRLDRISFPSTKSGSQKSPLLSQVRSTTTASLRADAPAFGHPIISGIGGTGFEQSIRLDPTDPNRIYTSAPGTASAETSWIWHSLDGGRTFKWVVGAAPFEGKVTTCGGGGDSEIAVDSAGHLYFNDLTLANFSTARSDDFGVTFTCSNTGVPDTAVDRQWYATDGDPTNGGSIYLTNDEIGPGGASCPGTPTPGNNTLVMSKPPFQSSTVSKPTSQRIAWD